MRRLLSILILTGNLYSQDWAGHMDSLIALEWQAMSHTDTMMIWWAYDESSKVGYREVGANWAVESRGDSTAINVEKNGDRCVGAGQNNARLAAIRVHQEKLAKPE